MCLLSPGLSFQYAASVLICVWLGRMMSWLDPTDDSILVSLCFQGGVGITDPMLGEVSCCSLTSINEDEP